MGAQPALPRSDEAAAGAAPDDSSSPTPERRPAFRLVPALAVVVALWWGQVVLIPLVLSVLISYALDPFVSRLEFLYIARPFAVPLVLITLFGRPCGRLQAIGQERCEGAASCARAGKGGKGRSGNHSCAGRGRVRSH